MNRCSDIADAIGEPLAGTAPNARGWLAIEQNGPYGHDALRDSHFPRDVAAELASRLNPLGVRPALIRAPGRHADDPTHHSTRTVFLASSLPGAEWLRRTTVEDPAQLLDIDLSAIFGTDTDPDPRLLPSSATVCDPVLLICTHAKRDVCCAIKGRPIAAELAKAERFEGRVWETSHLGGHRFAATAVQLPHGWVYGRLTAASAAEVLDAASTIPATMIIDVARGRSSRAATAQAAELAARTATGFDPIDGLRIDAAAADNTFEIRIPGRSEIVVRVEEQPCTQARPESCGKPEIAAAQWKTTLL